MSFWKRLFGGQKENIPVQPTPSTQPAALQQKPLPAFPFELIEVPGKEAFQKCLALRAEGAGKFTPVILGGRGDLSLLQDNFEITEESVEKILELANDVSPEQFLAQQKAADAEYYESLEPGDWPSDPQPSNGITADKELLGGRYKDSVLIAKIPTTNSYEVPAYLRLGNWNACPGAAEHVAILRGWHSLYGAEIICVTGDVIECTVTRPPMTKESAMKLAEEQYIYCTDIVEQGVGTIAALGGTLLNSKFWYFWWD